jgi:Exonuclease VII, large subunit
LSSAGTKLFSLNPVELLKKGYVIVEKDGKWVKSSSILREKDEISMRFFDGVVKVVVK